MSEIKKKIDHLFMEALKNKEEVKINAIRLLKSAIKNAEIEKKDVLSEGEILSIIRKLIKQREESIEAFKKGGREDLVDKEQKEMDILRSLLPPELSDEELDSIIEKAISETGAKGLSDMGKVMKAVMPEVQGRADGKRVSEIVRKKLGELQ